MFAIVQNSGELTRACGDISDFLAFRRQQEPPLLPDILLGILIDSNAMANLPYALPAFDNTGRPSTHIKESLSISELWTLCWVDRPISRFNLVRSLLMGAGRQSFDKDTRFIPVLRPDETEGNLATELNQLLQHFPELLMKPLYQERTSGRLFSFGSNLSRSGKTL